MDFKGKHGLGSVRHQVSLERDQHLQQRRRKKRRPRPAPILIPCSSKTSSDITNPAIKIARNIGVTKLNKHFSDATHYLRHLVDHKVVDVVHVTTKQQLADGMTKGSVERETLIAVCEHGTWAIVGEAQVYKQLRNIDQVSAFLYVDEQRY